jgi:hypothetical protein
MQTPLDTGRAHDVSGLSVAELERTRRELQASLTLARPGSPVRVPIEAQMSAIDTELASALALCSGRAVAALPPIATRAWTATCGTVRGTPNGT